MSRILIRQFGPIRKGYSANNGWIEIKKVTVLIGNQGSGKSTVAKLISTLSWLEKALVRGSLKESELLKDGFFKSHCSYQNIEDYFKQDTHIEFDGHAVHFIYKNGKIELTWKETNEYFLPKIMYTPAERNFTSAVRYIKNLKGLPGTLYTFSDEFLKAAESLKGPLDLPINGVKFEYQKLNELSSIVGDDYRIRLSQASSGFQSLVPLYIVTKYLSESLETTPANEFSIHDQNQIRKEIDRIVSNTRLTQTVKDLYVERLSSRFRYSSFLNIVEEPEQNLYPTSQHKILNSLFYFNKLNERNVLLITTHSPYLINYITLAVKAESLKENLSKRNLELLNEIVPPGSSVAARDLAIYQMDENTGAIDLLEDYKGIPSDENKLNEELGESNELYARLLEIQQGV
jgi:energy-coupling factor transporter ATP-binding protein EcfA2